MFIPSGVEVWQGTFSVFGLSSFHIDFKKIYLQDSLHFIPSRSPSCNKFRGLFHEVCETLRRGTAGWLVSWELLGMKLLQATRGSVPEFSCGE
jgi:hypothetical protein